MQIKEQLISKTKYKIKCPNLMTVKWIVIHNTANDASAQNEVNYMQSNNNQISYHFAVDDKEIIQALPLNRNGWHAGDGYKENGGNKCGIAIEICYSKSGGNRFLQAEKNAVWLAAKLLKDYEFDISHLKKHHDFANKYCPHRTMDLGWSRFVDMVKKQLQTMIPSSQSGNKQISVSYYPQYKGTSLSFVDALNTLHIDSSKTSRQQIALNNGIIGYSGTAKQNQQLFQLLKQGKLKKEK